MVSTTNTRVAATLNSQTRPVRTSINGTCFTHAELSVMTADMGKFQQELRPLEREVVATSTLV